MRGAVHRVLDAVCRLGRLPTGGVRPAHGGATSRKPLFAVKETYKRAGFELGKGRFFVFEDQLGVELTVSHNCSSAAPQPLSAGDQAEYRRQERELKRF
ncbi:MAG: hypothetical protein M5R42_06550 [Rhodocyclaceae bacterium]|nr:hypothetical protein [Rhodocyclaceae bacterium]